MPHEAPPEHVQLITSANVVEPVSPVGQVEHVVTPSVVILPTTVVPSGGLAQAVSPTLISPMSMSMALPSEQSARLRAAKDGAAKARARRMAVFNMICAARGAACWDSVCIWVERNDAASGLMGGGGVGVEDGRLAKGESARFCLGHRFCP